MRMQIEDLHAGYGRTDVLFGATLEVEPGSLLCLMGRNGVGKTTLLNAIMGLLPTNSGSIKVDDVDIASLPSHERARLGIGYVPQGHQVFPHMTVRENIVVVIERVGTGDQSAMDEALDVFPALRGLMERPAGLLSGGQAQQLAIARALSTRPKLLILDEPTEGIQPSIILQIEEAIAALHASSSMSILLVEQYVEFALRLAEKYAVMDHGRIMHAGDTATADMKDFAELLSV